MAGRKNSRELIEFLTNIVEKIVTNFEVDEIVLFGSYAKGTADDNSDIDVAVISPDLNMNYPIFENALTIIRKTDLYEPYLQLVPLPSAKYYNETFIDPGFISAIKNTGKKIYTKNSGINLQDLGSFKQF